MKKIVSFLLTITLLLCSGISVLAEEIPTPPADQISSNPDYSFVEKHFYHNPNETPSLRGGEVDLGFVSVDAGISKVSSTSVLATATTMANQICMQVGGVVFVERWNNNMWSTYYSISFETFSASSASTAEIINVEAGYYYRVRCVHMAFIMHSSVYLNEATKSIFIN